MGDFNILLFFICRSFPGGLSPLLGSDRAAACVDPQMNWKSGGGGGAGSWAAMRSCSFGVVNEGGGDDAQVLQTAEAAQSGRDGTDQIAEGGVPGLAGKRGTSGTSG